VATFKGISFIEDRSGPAYPGGEEDATATHVPGGNRTVIQSSGNLIQSMTVTADVTAAQFASLFSARGTQGSLVLFSGTRTARLRKVDDATLIGYNDLYQTRLTFWLL
jgi:hypothetical protein